MAISISYIIPYYDIEPDMLTRCLKSLIDACNGIEYEIIVVDDGSKIYDAQQIITPLDNPNIKLIRQPNKGLSEARNTGLRCVSKSYIQFVDSDDYLFVDSYRELLKILDGLHPDLLKFKYEKVGIGHKNRKKRTRNKVKQYATGVDYMAQNSVFAGAWSYVFSSKHSNLRFTPNIYHEDEDYTPRLLMETGLTIATDYKAYAYFQRADSIINQRNEGTINKRFSDLLSIVYNLKCTTESEPNSFKSLALQRRCWQLSSSIVYMLIFDSPTTEFLIDKIKELAKLRLWPLMRRMYTWRYLLFSIATDRFWKLKLLKLIFNK